MPGPCVDPIMDLIPTYLTYHLVLLIFSLTLKLVQMYVLARINTFTNIWICGF